MIVAAKPIKKLCGKSFGVGDPIGVEILELVPAYIQQIHFETKAFLDVTEDDAAIMQLERDEKQMNAEETQRRKNIERINGKIAELEETSANEEGREKSLRAAIANLEGQLVAIGPVETPKPVPATEEPTKPDVELPAKNTDDKAPEKQDDKADKPTEKPAGKGGRSFGR